MKSQRLGSREKNFIICVDDEQSILNQLSTQLDEAFGDLCMIEYAESAEEALGLMEEIKQDGGSTLVVISDQVMPGMKGGEFLEIVNRRFPGVRKVLLTGYAGLESAMYAINHADLDRYLEKPWDRQEFLSIVQQLLGATVESSLSESAFRIREAIQNVQMFRDLSLDAVDLIAEKLQLVAFPKDVFIFKINDPGDCLYIIKSGEVKVVAGEDDTDEVLAYLGRGSYFGEMALLTGEPRSASIVTTMDTELFMLTKQDFDQLLARHPSIAVTLSHVLSQRLRDLSVKRAGRQNKLICVINPLADMMGHDIVIHIAQRLVTETNGRVVLVDIAPVGERIRSTGEDTQESKGAYWVIQNLDNIQEEELEKLLPVDENGVKFFMPPLQKEPPLSTYIVQLLSLFKEFYNFVLIHVKADAEFHDNIMKVVEQSNTVLYLLKQPETPEEGDLETTMLRALHQEQPNLIKKTELVVLRETPDSSFSEQLSGLVDRTRIHYLRVGDTAQMLFRSPSETVVTVSEPAPQAQRDVSRIARRLGNVSVGLVLGGGGARAYAHLGILKVLEEEHIPVDLIAGTSMGGFLGALHILGKSVDEILAISQEAWRRLNSPFSWTLPRVAFIKDKRIDRLVHDIFGDILIEDLPLPFFCVAADLVSGQEVVLSSGPLYKAILATGALPAFFAPVSIKNMFLVDGGVVNNVPGDVLKKQGIDMVIAVDVTPEREVHLVPQQDCFDAANASLRQRLLCYLKYIKARFGTVLLPRIIMRVIAIEGLEITRNKSRYFDIHIKPNLENFDLFDFRRLPEIVKIGEQTGRQEIEKIRQTIASLKRTLEDQKKAS